MGSALSRPSLAGTRLPRRRAFPALCERGAQLAPRPRMRVERCAAIAAAGEARAIARLASLGVTGLLVWVAACGDYNEAAGRSTSDPCAQQTAQAGAAHSVVCPGTATCYCAAPDACCMARIDGTAGTCGSPRTCGGLSLTCDGPEDCGGGVCCLDEGPGGGSSCMAASSCVGRWLCRSDGDCAGSPGGSSCRPADFGQQGVSDRGLDGLIGVCQR
jgi:hypothetical protein